MDITQAFGARLKFIRNQLGLTQEAFAFKCDLQASHIGQLERGVKCPTLETLYKISQGIGLPLPKLLALELAPEIPDNGDNVVNHIYSLCKSLPEREQTQVLKIVKTFSDKE